MLDTVEITHSKLVSLSVQIEGSVTYNGRPFSAFQPLRTANYVEQNDTRLIPEMTVRETLNFSARCQGSGLKKGKD